jgi:hypothetical protein
VRAFYQRLFTAGVEGSVSFRVRKPADVKDSLWPEGEQDRTGPGDGEVVADAVLNRLAALEASQLQKDLVVSAKSRTARYLPGLRGLAGCTTSRTYG